MAYIYSTLFTATMNKSVGKKNSNWIFFCFEIDNEEAQGYGNHHKDNLNQRKRYKGSGVGVLECWSR